MDIEKHFSDVLSTFQDATLLKQGGQKAVFFNNSSGIRKMRPEIRPLQ